MSNDNAWAGYGPAQEALRNDDFSTAVDLFTPLAESGFSDAFLPLMYAGVRAGQRPAEVRGWGKKLAASTMGRHRGYNDLAELLGWASTAFTSTSEAQFQSWLRDGPRTFFPPQGVPAGSTLRQIHVPFKSLDALREDLPEVVDATIRRIPDETALAFFPRVASDEKAAGPDDSAFFPRVIRGPRPTPPKALTDGYADATLMCLGQFRADHVGLSEVPALLQVFVAHAPGQPVFDAFDGHQAFSDATHVRLVELDEAPTTTLTPPSATIPIADWWPTEVWKPDPERMAFAGDLQALFSPLGSRTFLGGTAHGYPSPPPPEAEEREFRFAAQFSPGDVLPRPLPFCDGVGYVFLDKNAPTGTTVWQK